MRPEAAAQLQPGPGTKPQGATPALVEPLASANDLLTRGSIHPEETAVSQWRDSMVDRPETDGAAYLTGWTISGVAVLGAIVAVWALGI
jgi:hypothetical protein